MDAIKRFDNAFFRQLLFIVALIIIGIIIFNQLGYLLSGALGAITLYVVFRPLYKLLSKKGWKSGITATLITLLVVISMVGIGAFIYWMVISEIPAIDTDGLVPHFTEWINNINQWIGKEIIPPDFLAQSRDFFINLASSVLNTTYSVIINLFMMIVLVYSMFAYAGKMEKAIEKYFPFKGTSRDQIKHEIKNMIFGNAVGIPLIMVVQALVSSVGYWIFGLPDVGFWAFMTGIVGLIPVVGTAGVWLPLGIYQLATGNIWQGISLIIYGALIISNADNVARLILMKKMANVNPLITIFGVILGIPLFGFWGIIFGPLLISGFLLLLKIYFEEYGENNEKTH